MSDLVLLQTGNVQWRLTGQQKGSAYPDETHRAIESKPRTGALDLTKDCPMSLFIVSLPERSLIPVLARTTNLLGRRLVVKFSRWFRPEQLEDLR
jgi:hypothetical protein